MTKHLKYLSYILRHKWFVFWAGLKVSAPIWRLLIHDWSKFLPSEWLPYAEFFYGDRVRPTEARHSWAVHDPSGQAKIADDFDVAWLHHQKRNKHHWQYWVLEKDDGGSVPLLMPMSYVREMVADWAGAGRAITGAWSVNEWYKKNRDKIRLHPITRSQVNVLLENFEQEIQ